MMALKTRAHCLSAFAVMLMASILAIGVRPSALSADDCNPRDSWTELIDRQLAALWRSAEVEPTPVCDDATFLRRVSLDLIGRIPTVAEARNFLEGPTTTSRAELVDRLLQSPLHARHMATVWRRIWIPQADTQQFAAMAAGYESWLARRLREDARYDDLVREQLTVPLSALPVPVDSDLPGIGSPAFLAAAELEPDRLAANVARAFLGINLDCAQCHNHPFARWSQDEFWQTAAFFARPPNPTGQESSRLEIAVGDTDRTVSARFLTGQTPKTPPNANQETGRELLAKWIASPENPYLSRNAVNRVWAQCLGNGLIEPLDDLSAPPTSPHANLLDELANNFARGGYPLDRLIRAIVLSRAYQGTAPRTSDAYNETRQAFAAMPVRGLTGEQLHDSLVTAAGLSHGDHDESRRRDFAGRFHIGRPAEAQRSLVQSLLLMNGELTADAAQRTTPLLRALAAAPFLEFQEQLDTMFLAAYSRRAKPHELAQLQEHFADATDQTAVFADVFWAMLNSIEFNTNH